MQTLFFRLLARDDKEATLRSAIATVNRGELAAHVFHVDPSSFRQVPGSPFAYWVSDRIRRLFRELEACEGSGREVRYGGINGDDFRYLRLFCERPARSILTWCPYQKGGEYSACYSDIHLVVDWDPSRRTYRGFTGLPGRTSELPANYECYFRPGITWSRRSQQGMSMRVLLAGCVFSDKGPVIFSDEHVSLPLLAIINSPPFRSLLALQMAFGSYEVGVIQRTPVPDMSYAEGGQLGKLAFANINLKRDLDRVNETSHVFHLPALLQVPEGTLAERVASWRSRVGEVDKQLAENQREIDDIAFRLYGIEGVDRRAIEEGVATPTPSDEETGGIGG